MKYSNKTGFLFIFLAAVLWGTVGPVSRILFATGVHPMTAAFFRGAIGLLVLFPLLLVGNKKMLYISKRDIPFFALFGFLSVTCFSFFYFITISLISVAGAVVLLYTAPAFATLLAWFFLKEPLSKRKVVCIFIALVGAFLVVGGYNLALYRLNLLGIFTGLLSGLTYAGYSVFGKKALKKYHYWTVVFYSLAFGCLFLLIGTIPWGFFLPFTLVAIGSATYLALIATLAAYGLYSRGLIQVEAGRATVVATVEVVVAVFLGVVLLHEELTLGKLLGVAMVLAAALLIQES